MGVGEAIAIISTVVVGAIVIVTAMYMIAEDCCNWYRRCCCTNSADLHPSSTEIEHAPKPRWMRAKASNGHNQTTNNTSHPINV